MPIMTSLMRLAGMGRTSVHIRGPDSRREAETEGHKPLYHALIPAQLAAVQPERQYLA